MGKRDSDEDSGLPESVKVAGEFARTAGQHISKAKEGSSWFVRLLVNLAIAVIALALISGCVLWPLYRVTCLTWTENYQFVYAFDKWTGDKYPINHTGYVYAPFWLKAIHTIDLRPVQVKISAIQRVLNAKLVHFDPYGKDPKTGEYGWQMFIRWHGRGDYEGPGTISNQNTANDNLFVQILTNYAYDGTSRSYPFLVIEKELGGSSLESQSAAAASTPGAKQ